MGEGGKGLHAADFVEIRLESRTFAPRKYKASFAFCRRIDKEKEVNKTQKR